MRVDVSYQSRSTTLQSGRIDRHSPSDDPRLPVEQIPALDAAETVVSPTFSLGLLVPHATRSPSLYFILDRGHSCTYLHGGSLSGWFRQAG